MTLRLEISPQYHDSVKGRSGKNVMNIINQTGAMVSTLLLMAFT